MKICFILSETFNQFQSTLDLTTNKPRSLTSSGIPEMIHHQIRKEAMTHY